MGRLITLKICAYCKELKYCDRKYCSPECYWKDKKGRIPWNKKYFNGTPASVIREWRRIANQNYNKKPGNLLKRKARYALNKALQAGEIQRQSCEMCGKEKVEAHHCKGYEKKYWLEVQWLCKRHHVQIHLNN